jgi:glutamine synthetase
MRDGEGGMKYITDMLELLGTKHAEHISVYGDDNHKRLTGHHETSDMKTFSYGVGNRASSFRIPTSTAAEKKGYVEDRRPASNIDPYLVTAMIVDTSLCHSKLSQPMLDHYYAYQAWKQQNPIDL